MRHSVLVAVASKHGGTAEIAETIARRLAWHRLAIDYHSIGVPLELPNVRGVVLGSAVYGGHWRPEAVAFLRRHSEELKELPIWLFQSGPGGLDDRLPADVTALTDPLWVQDRQTFGGRIIVDLTGAVEHRIVRAGIEGDCRDLSAARCWADQIAESLTALVGIRSGEV